MRLNIGTRHKGQTQGDVETHNRFMCIRRFTNVDGSSWSRRTVLLENQGIRFGIPRTQLPMMSAGVFVSSTFFPSGDSTRTPATVTCVWFKKQVR
jgi:hypothetical protein